MNLSDQTLFNESVEEKVRRHADAIYRRTDRMFAVLMPVQWIGGIIAALVITPLTWIGARGYTHPHVLFAIVGGGVLCSLPVALALLRPGMLSTRMVIACSQVLFSSMLIHLTGGRIETHFHVFVSLAFLATYRDWRVLVPPTIIVAVDHFVRGVWWPESVFGVATAGEWRWLEHAAWVVFEDIGLFISIRQSVAEMYDLARNTTQVELTAETLAESAREIRKLSLVASKAPQGVIIADSECRIEWVNDSFSQMSGRTLHEVIGKRPDEILHGPKTDPETVKYLRQRLQNRQSVSTEILHYTKDGDGYWVSLEIGPVLNDNQETVNFVGLLTNISERKAYEAELQHAKDASESANLAKSQFLANMSHEIRTPLNGILGFTELLRRSSENLSDEERQEYLQAINSSGRHLLTLINDILDISKIEAGQLQSERVPCSPHRIIAEVVSILRVPAQEKGINLDYRWESGIPETILSDSLQIKQVLMNLVGNAIKFTEQGTVLVVASLVGDAKRSRLRLEVRDTGIGIPIDKMQKIFEPFAQADDSVTRRYGGTGLGLAISKKAIELLGGELSVNSELGRGSVFSATIDAGDLSGVTILEKPPENIIADVTNLESGPHLLTGLKILLVEDGDTNRKLLRVVLARGGAEVVTAEHGRIAVQLASEQDFDIILMDMQMPVMDGYSATRILRDRGFDGPIIALTAHAMKGDRKKCQEAGCSGYLAKPIDMDQLVRTVTKETRRKPSGGPAAEPAVVAPTSPTVSYIPREVRSLLPTDDPEIRDIVSEFVEKLGANIQEMESATERQNYDQLAQLAHWLKGAGGTVGYDCFTEPALELEQFAKEENRTEIGERLRYLRALEQVLVV